MKALFNDQILNSADIVVSPEDRAFQYGDGIFETIAVIKGEPRHLEWHVERLAEALSVLKINMPAKLIWPEARNTVNAVVLANEFEGDLRLKIQVWRTSGGLYKPHNSQANCLITCTSADFSQPAVRSNVSISKTIFNQYNPLSKFKTMSALKYVMAGIEIKERQLDEIIITDVNNNISECLASNLFWTINNEYYTPDLMTGCINGIMRKHILRELQRQHVSVHVGLWQAEALYDAETVFTSNSAGIQHIVCIDDKTFARNNQIEAVVYG